MYTKCVPGNESAGRLELHYDVDIGAAKIELVRMPKAKLNHKNI